MMRPGGFATLRSLRRDQSVQDQKVPKGTTRRILRFVSRIASCWRSSSC